MADTKISDLPTDITTLADGDEFPVADASALTADTFATALEIKTYVNTKPVWAAGSTAANSWPKLTAGTLLTTPEVGAFELDGACLYGCSDAGNRGYIPLRHFIRADATRTLPNDANENAIFNVPTNGRITLEIGTYLFEGIIRVTSMSATSGNALIDILGAGTATAGAWLWWYSGIDATDPSTPATFSSGVRVTQDSAASIVPVATATGLAVIIKGTFEITVAGTLIPSIDQVTAAAAVVSIGSYILFERIGASTLTSVGQWD